MDTDMHPAGKKIVWLAFVAVLYATTPSVKGDLAASPQQAATLKAAAPAPQQCTRDEATSASAGASQNRA